MFCLAVTTLLALQCHHMLLLVSNVLRCCFACRSHALERCRSEIGVPANAYITNPHTPHVPHGPMSSLPVYHPNIALANPHFTSTPPLHHLCTTCTLTLHHPTRPYTKPTSPYTTFTPPLHHPCCIICTPPLTTLQSSEPLPSCFPGMQFPWYPIGKNLGGCRSQTV